jgi:hypothetical protein
MLVKVKSNIKKYGLTSDRKYVVIGLDDKYIRVIDDFGEPVLFHHKLFNVLKSTIPHDWVWNCFDDGEIHGDPPELCKPGYYEDLFDGKKKAIIAFVSFLRRIDVDTKDLAKKWDMAKKSVFNIAIKKYVTCYRK